MMQSRFTAKGVNQEGKDVFLAYELKEEEFKVNLFIIPAASLKAADRKLLETEWVEGKEYLFPEDTVCTHPNLNAETILPEEIRSEETGKIRIKQNEWAYILLTAKLWESYLIELEALKKRSDNLTQYERQLFDDAKSFWERVLEHRKEKDLSQERLDKIKEEVNSVFEKLKTFRKSESAEFEAASAKQRDEIIVRLEDVRKQVDAKSNFKLIGESLKSLQNDSRKNRYTKADEQILRKAFDAAYQYLNERRNFYFSDKNAARIKGLTEVIEKMEASLSRDRKDLEYLDKKSSRNSIQSLELQLIKVKSNMLKEAITSKEEKLKDIRQTLEKLQEQNSRLHKTKDAVVETNSETAGPSGEDAGNSDIPQEAQPES